MVKARRSDKDPAEIECKPANGRSKHLFVTNGASTWGGQETGDIIQEYRDTINVLAVNRSWLNFCNAMFRFAYLEKARVSR